MEQSTNYGWSTVNDKDNIDPSIGRRLGQQAKAAENAGTTQSFDLKMDPVVAAAAASGAAIPAAESEGQSIGSSDDARRLELLSGHVNGDSTSPVSPPTQDSDDKHNGRMLSQSKRAMQNRAAQRAFRQRKEMYIKDLELKVNELKEANNTIDALKQENLELRDYILALQSRWVSQPGGIPTPPSVLGRLRFDSKGIVAEGENDSQART